jgi:hypothetical protein
MTTAFLLTEAAASNPNVKAGTVVFKYRGYDYGCAADDTAITGEKHISVTLDPEGGTPFFTVRKDHLQGAE